MLGLAANDVRPLVADTDSVGYTDVTGGSRTTFATGLAAYEAAQDAKRQLNERAAKLWEMKPEDVDFDDGVLSSKSNGVKPLTFKELARGSARTGGPIIGRATVNPRGVGPAFATTSSTSRSIPRPAR